MADPVYALALAKKIDQRAAELATIIEQDMVLYGLKPDMRAIMMNAVGTKYMASVELGR